MIRRWLMRRAYNFGQWDFAKQHAQLLLTKPNEIELARSVYIRSCWNLNLLDEVVELNTKWDNDFEELAERSKYKLAKLERDKNNFTTKMQRLQGESPCPQQSEIQWNKDDMISNFFQEESRVWMAHPNGWIYWDMPATYSLENTHPDLLRLVAEILLKPWEPSAIEPFGGTRPLGNNPSLAFSAGTDSTAASLVMPDHTILGYHRRDFKSLIDHRNAERLIEHINCQRDNKVVDIASNHELIRTYRGLQIGFSTDFASGVHLILLADHYDIGALAFGTPLDNTWLAKGRRFREFSETHYFQYWSKRFHSAGIELYFPIAGISEAGAMKICEKASIIEFMNSCLRGNGLQGCGKCWKCFHKNGPLGRDFDFNSKEIQTFINKTPLPTTTHALWALQRMDIADQVPHLGHLLDIDFSWWASYYPPAKEILPSRWKEETWERIAQYLQPMSEPYLLHEINHYNE